MIRGTITSRKSALLDPVLEAKKSPCADGFIIEGARFVADLMPQNVITVFISSVSKYPDIVKGFDNVYEVTAQVLQKISSAVSGQEVVAYVKKQNPELPQRLVLLDDVQDSGNVGTIIRTASSFGYGVIVSEKSANPYSVKTARSTAGALLGCYVERASIAQKIKELKKEGYQIFTTELDKNAALLQNVKPENRFAVVIGNEGNGVSSEVSSAADKKIYIPIEKENSLNASVAAGITMYSMRNNDG